MLFNLCRFCENKLSEGTPLPHPRRYPYFVVVVVIGLAWSNGPESYAGGSVSIGRATRPERPKVMTQTKK
jgi:hypothetical protein